MNPAPLSHIIGTGTPLDIFVDFFVELILPLLVFIGLYLWQRRKERRKP
ncbi:MAG: hypothetical protein M3O91_03955 [Chloroflexota bacterium]|nr:hypothetical protein [Chloroflexota bacterium]